MKFIHNCLTLKWCGRELNPRHKDFQSFALPTELPHPLIWDGKNRTNPEITKKSQPAIIVF